MQSQDSYNESIENNQKLVEQKKSSIMETNKMVEKNIQQTLPEHIKNILIELNDGLYEKERSIRLTLLAVLAGESTFMLGEPGTAKSLIARRISEAFEDTNNKDEIKFFDYLMNQFSQPDEIFGPISVQELKNDNYKRKTSKYLPKAQFAFLDEIWKANPAIQNALLTILNEKLFRNGGEMERVPLIGFMSASNELPAKNQGLDAIFDRFLVRILERPVSKNSDSFRKMISDVQELFSIKEKISLDEINIISQNSKNVKLSDECYDIILHIAKIASQQNEHIENKEDKWLISDRRWKKIVNLMRVLAFCNGRTETDIMDATIIADCIWQNEQQEEDAKNIVKEAIENYGLKCNTNFEDLKKCLKEFTKKVDKKFFKEEINKGDFVTKTIDNIEFYVVEDVYGNQYNISVSPYRRNTYSSNRNQYYIDGTRNVIEGDYTNGMFRENGNRYRSFTIIREKDTKTLVLDNFYNEKPEEGKVIVQKFNETDYLPLHKLLDEELSAIDKQINECEKKYGDNLFANIGYYLSVITTKLTDSKGKINDLIAQLEHQKERYDIK